MKLHRITAVMASVTLMLTLLSGPGLRNVTGAAVMASTCGKTYYVDPKGSDSRAGTTPSTAWRSLAKVSSSTLAPGTCVLLKGGATFSGTLSLGSDDGNDPANPVVVSSYGRGSAMISSGKAKGLSIYNTGGVQITNLVFKGSGASSNTSNGIDLYTDTPHATKYSGILISHVDVSGYGASGISIIGSPSDGSKSGFRDFSILNSAVHDNGDAGIQSSGNYSTTATTYAHASVLVRQVMAYNNRGISNKGTHSGSGVVLGDVNGATIEYSTAYNNGENNNYPFGGPFGIWAWDSNRVVIQHNESYGDKSLTSDGGGFDLDGSVTNSVMQYNYSHDNAGSGFMVYQFDDARPQSNNTVRYNISQNDARKTGAAITTGAEIGSLAQNIDVYGNTVYVSQSTTNVTTAGIRVREGTQNARFFNNIVYSRGGAILASIEKSTTATFLGDDWWSHTTAFKVLVGGSDSNYASATTYSSLAAWSSATGSEMSNGRLVGKSVDPQLRNAGGGGTIRDATRLACLAAYKLKPTSTLVNAGVDLSTYGISNGGYDYYGDPAPVGAYAIGAYEPAS